MNSFTNSLQFTQNELEQTPEGYEQPSFNFSIQKLESDGKTDDVLGVKSNQQNYQQSDNQSLVWLEENIHGQKEEQDFQQNIQINLKRYTSIQNGFMDNHRKILKNSLQQYLRTIPNFEGPITNEQLLYLTPQDIKSYIFNKKIFNSTEIKENRQIHFSKYDDFKMLKDIFESLRDINRTIVKDAMLLACLIFKKTDKIYEKIKQKTEVNFRQVQELVCYVTSYLRGNSKVQIIKPQKAVTEQSKSKLKFLIQSWVFTVLVAKLGYFDSQCYEDANLKDHLQNLLTTEKHYSSINRFNPQDLDQLDRQFSSKKIKFQLY